MTRDGWRKINLSISKSLMTRVDEYRFEKRFPTRAEALRSLLEEALDNRFAPDADSAKRSAGKAEHNQSK